jgi:hypothetical protein
LIGKAKKLHHGDHKAWMKQMDILFQQETKDIAGPWHQEYQRSIHPMHDCIKLIGCPLCLFNIHGWFYSCHVQQNWI